MFRSYEPTVLLFSVSQFSLFWASVYSASMLGAQSQWQPMVATVFGLFCYAIAITLTAYGVSRRSKYGPPVFSFRMTEPVRKTVDNIKRMRENWSDEAVIGSSLAIYELHLKMLGDGDLLWHRTDGTVCRINMDPPYDRPEDLD